jgi:hypothetical protein
VGEEGEGRKGKGGGRGVTGAGTGKVGYRAKTYSAA